MESKVDDSLEETHVANVSNISVNDPIDTGGETTNDPQTNPMDGSDDSEDEEHDVKVCDICGDAGREDLLAVCCKCTDGAEHTYCMGEMLEKVPEGDWLCEECKYEQDMKAQKKNKTGKVDNRIDKTYPFGQKPVISSDHPGKAEPKCFDSKGEASVKECSYLKASGKRRVDNSEISSAPKRQALESFPGSPRAQSPNNVDSLSRESSFKNLEKGKVRVHQTNDSSASDSQLKTSQGTFSKSNSFNSVIGNRKVKLVDEVFPSRRKLIGETVSSNSKDGPVRSMGKSMSLKSTSLNHFSGAESVVKTSSPRFSLDWDIKGKRHSKEQSLFERKNSLRSESMAGSIISSSKFDKKSTPHCDPLSLSSMNNNRDSKAMKSDGNPVTVSKSSEVKKQEPYFDGDSLAKGVSNCEENPKEHIDERPPCVANQVLLDGSSQPNEHIDEKTRDSSGSHSNQNITANGKTSCQKCKGIGHSVQFCKADKPVVDAPVVKNSTNTPSDLKAAIEAAMLRKPGICRKSRVPDQSENFSPLNMNSESYSQDQLSSSHSKRNLSCAVNVHERFEILLKTAIPEHQYIWRGGFEVHKSGKTLDLCDGIQAHLSTCASPKVLDAVQKFPCKVLLNEVSRLSTWPMQFQEFGVREDNIALFFFAKDLGSYEKSYKVLLRNLMKHDLALQGNFGGIELLIFPSNQLPENLQRWNMMFFLWGVFRGKRGSCSPYVPGAVKPLTQDIPRTIAPSPENMCSVGPTENSICSTPTSDTEIPASEVSQSASSPKVIECTTSDCKPEMECLPVQKFSNPNTCDQMSVPWATPADRHMELHNNFDKAPDIVHDTASLGSSLKDSSNKHDATLSDVSLVSDNVDVDPTMNMLSSSMQWKVLQDNQLHKAPNLELALGAETKPSIPEIPPFFAGKVEKTTMEDYTSDSATMKTKEGDSSDSLSLSLAGKVEKTTMEDYTSDNATMKAKEEDSSASLSLSLSFPFPDKLQSSPFGGLREKTNQ